MALEGNLRDFSLEHIFQLIHTGKKTGSLHIVRGSGEAEAFVYFRTGKIFGAVSNFNRVPIGERLVGAGQLMAKDLTNALELQKNDKKRRKLGQILVSEGLITPEILKQIVREQIQSTVFDLLPWEEGEFQFSPQLPPIEDIGLLVSAKKVLSEGNQRLNEWDRVREKVPSLGAVFAINDMAPRHKNITLSPKHWKLLRFVDGKRCVTELALIARISEFETSAVLYDLAEAELLRLMYEKESGKDKSAVPEEVESQSELEGSKDSAGADSGALIIDNAPLKLEKSKAEPISEAPPLEEIEDRGAGETAEVFGKQQVDGAVAPTVPAGENAAEPNFGGHDFQPELDINGLDNMVSEELVAYRGDFMNELTALTGNTLPNSRFLSKHKASKKTEKINADAPLDKNLLSEVIKRLK